MSNEVKETKDVRNMTCDKESYLPLVNNNIKIKNRNIRLNVNKRNL